MGNIMCLFISVFVERYGPRVMIMITNLCATAGIIMSSFAPNAAVLFITYGIIPGMMVDWHTPKKRLIDFFFTMFLFDA